METLPTVKDLLEAGVHFGHQTKRWNPKMKKYIFTSKNDIHIIDLSKTLESLAVALDFIEQKASEGGEIVFVGTKRQAQEVVEAAAKNTNVYYVTNRWVGGLLTNFTITKKNMNKMAEIEEGMVKGFENRTKQEITLMGKELERLQRLYGGIKGMTKKPAVIVLADPHHEKIVVKEAQKLNIPIVAVVDTNCDPDEVDYVIPGNDDAIGSIALFFRLFSQAVEEGRRKAQLAKEAKSEATQTPKENNKPKEVKKEEPAKEEKSVSKEKESKKTEEVPAVKEKVTKKAAKAA